MESASKLTVEVEIDDSVDGECDHHECESKTDHLWYGVTPEPDENIVYSYLAEYCNQHSQTHAEPGDNLHYIGGVNRDR